MPLYEYRCRACGRTFEQLKAVFDAVGSPQKTLAVFAGGSHSMFTDRRTTGGETLNPRVKTATKELSLAFLRSVLEGEHEALDSWPRRFGGMTLNQFHNATGKDLSLVAADTTAEQLLVLNHRTAPDLPVVWAVARGSFINKAILVPAALLISAFAPWLVTPLLRRTWCRPRWSRPCASSATTAANAASAARRKARRRGSSPSTGCAPPGWPQKKFVGFFRLRVFNG